MQEHITAEQLRKAKRKQEGNKFSLRFLQHWTPELPMPHYEYRFHPVRKWRFDLAWPQIKLAVEFHGGNFVGGGHNRGAHQASDYEKMNEAQRLGWIVLQFGTVQLKEPEECVRVTIDTIAIIGERVSAEGVLREVRNTVDISCENLHHKKSERHGMGESCPVENRLLKLLEAR